ncbi:hypothetical protein D1B31_03930 [Neobacillus notoginsengisoli]|uniref:Fibronectin type-III domain-containing protein n=1 Tax=Neobacillus notoginsengisoli TaxID=1578198 RepID=A0A417YYF6_9BACI|nr:Ig-like domain-containing protein [Neobacillus notoginsengisoli]RHW42744.1 hypothetical protein D1B31_03930 [Neobacillus notoginsengisoli]
MMSVNLRKWLVGVVAGVLVFSSFGPFEAESVEASNYERMWEFPELRTENSSTFWNTNRSLTVDLYPFPVHEKDHTGKFVRKDLTAIDGPVSQISFVSDSERGTNFASGGLVKVGTDENGTYRTFIHFGNKLPKFTPNQQILNAKLQLYQEGGGSEPPYGSPRHKDATFSVHNVLTAWDGGRLTWDSQPQLSELPTTSETIEKAVDSPRFSWDVTDVVRKWQKNPDSSHGLALKATDESKPGSGVSFEKIPKSITYIPVLQINYIDTKEFDLTARGYGSGRNSQQGGFDLRWSPLPGSNKVGIQLFNGKDYEEIGIGEGTLWSSVGKNIWPTKEQIANGEYRLRLDGSGGPFADNPGPVYQNAVAQGIDQFAYYFRVVAYYDDFTVISEPVKAYIPDQTAPSAPKNIRVNELHSNFTISWDPSVDDRAGIKNYQVFVRDVNTRLVLAKTTDETQITLNENVLTLGQRYEIVVRAYDKSGWEENFADSEAVIAQPRRLRDAIVSGYSMPVWPVEATGWLNLRLLAKNEGTEEWSAANGYEIRVEGLPYSYRLNPDEVVKSGEVGDFSFTIKDEKPLGKIPIKYGIYHPETGWVGRPVEGTITVEDRTAPTINLEAPSRYDILKGDVSFKGTISDVQLKSYSILYGKGESPADWETIKTVSDGSGIINTTWNTRGIPYGLYTLRIFTEDTSGNSSVFDIVVTLNTPPMPPSFFGEVTDFAKVITGKAEPRSTVKVSTKGGVLLGSAQTGDDGTFMIQLPAAQPAGTVLEITTTDLVGNMSRPIYVTVIDKTPPAAPKVTTVTDRSITITGTAEKGAYVEIVKGTSRVAEGYVKEDGTFSITLLQKQPAGTVLTVTATDQANNKSMPARVTVLDKTPPPAPKVNSVADNSTAVTGTAEKGATIKVTRGTTVLGTAAVRTDGTYSVSIPKQAVGTILKVTATDKALNVSAAASMTVIDKTPPPAPRINPVANTSTAISGTAEKYAVVRIFKGSTVIASTSAKADGKYSVAIPKQAAGTILYVTATDKAKNVSVKAKTTVIDKIAPAIPTVNAVYSTHTTVKGKAEKSSYITVKSGKTIIGTAQTDTKGNYTVKIKRQKRGTTLTITAKDKAGNTSQPRTVKVK